MEIQKYVRISLLLALSIVLNLIESLFPVFNGIIPGLKIGLANTVVLVVIYIYGFKDAILISILRVFLVGILRTGLFNTAFLFSLSGAVLSTITMYLAYKFIKFSTIGVSIIGAISHSIGQILIASLILTNVNIIYYLPIMILFSIPAGIITGLISKELIKVLEKRLK